MSTVCAGLDSRAGSVQLPGSGAAGRVRRAVLGGLLVTVVVALGAGRAEAAWAVSGDGSSSARARQLVAPAAPSVQAGLFGCLLSSLTVSWPDPPQQGTSLDVVRVDGSNQQTVIASSRTAAGSVRDSGVAVLGFAPQYFLVNRAGSWQLSGPSATCGS
ncbi:hypothetical protein F0L68_11925 [Solihabitans fulvus]|uniref:Uncharacterized protein n=1 Tax=Solihabitans fulvus TaxID=1892852 RepID=A0A5B2XHS1_9PSEU|nr:hypothetical protein [Solihabitans fulvus]KAA2262605.1 hypothetical protein F0L68_11925 [Solihabitans fulvus]